MTDTEISAIARKMMMAEHSGLPIVRWKARLYNAIAKQIREEKAARESAEKMARRVA